MDFKEFYELLYARYPKRQRNSRWVPTFVLYLPLTAAPVDALVFVARLVRARVFKPNHVYDFELTEMPNCTKFVIAYKRECTPVATFAQLKALVVHMLGDCLVDPPPDFHFGLSRRMRFLGSEFGLEYGTNVVSAVSHILAAYPDCPKITICPWNPKDKQKWDSYFPNYVECIDCEAYVWSKLSVRPDELDAMMGGRVYARRWWSVSGVDIKSDTTVDDLPALEEKCIRTFFQKANKDRNADVWRKSWSLTMNPGRTTLAFGYTREPPTE